MAINADCAVLMRVQAYPAGPLHLGEPDSLVVPMAAEASSSTGGAMLVMQGLRFCNMQYSRDFVTDKTRESHGITLGNYTDLFLCLYSKPFRESDRYYKHCSGCGIVKLHKCMVEPSVGYKFLVVDIVVTFSDVDGLVDNQSRDLEDGPCETYGGGRARDKSGKELYRDLLLESSDQFHTVIVASTILYYTSGFKSSAGAECKNAIDKVIGCLPGSR